MNEIQPRIIKTDAEYRKSLTVVESLMNRDPEPESEEGKLLETWSVLINDYEERRFPIDSPDPVEAIKFRMEQMNIDRKNIIRIFGSKTSASEILNNKRPLSLKMIRSLHEELHIPSDILISIKDSAGKKRLYSKKTSPSPIKNPSAR